MNKLIKYCCYIILFLVTNYFILYSQNTNVEESHKSGIAPQKSDENTPNKIITGKNKLKFYEDVNICGISWMKQNLDVTHYRNGDSIPEVRDRKKWLELKTGAWCYYNNDTNNGKNFGKLYNWYAVNDPRGLAPVGWHIPSDDEWKELEKCLGIPAAELDKEDRRGTNEAVQLKSIEFDSRKKKNNDFEEGFKALPCGGRNADGKFKNHDKNACWWTNTEYSNNLAIDRYIRNNETQISRYVCSKTNGCSVRCVKD